MSDRILTTSWDFGYPVAVTYRNYSGVGTAAAQHFIGVDASSDVQWTLRSYGGSKPLAVALTDPVGGHVTALSVHVGNAVGVVGSVGVGQLGGPWSVVGSTVVTQGDSPWISRLASGSAVTGSVGATQLGAWTFTGSVDATQRGTWTFTGDVRQLGAPWSVVGSQVVTQGDSPWISRLASGSTVTGSFLASQGGAPWTFTGSVGVTQLGSLFVGIVASGVLAAVHSDGGGGMLRVLVASQAGGGSTITGSVWASQANTPWLVTGSTWAAQAGSWMQTVGQMAGFASSFLSTTSVLANNATYTSSALDLLNYAGAIVSIYADAPSATDGIKVEYSEDNANWDFSLAYTLGGSGSIAFNVTPNARYLRLRFINGTTSQGAFRLATIAKPLHFQIGQLAVTEQGSWSFFLVDSKGLMASVSSYGGDGALLRVDLVRGGAGDGAILDGSDSTIRASVRSYASGLKPQLTQLVASGGVLAEVTSLAGGGALKVDLVQGTITAADGRIQDRANTNIMASVVSYATGVNPLVAQLVSSAGYLVDVLSTARGAGLLVTQADSPWAATISSLAVRQSNAPWTFTGSAAVYGPLPVGSSYQGSGFSPVFLGGYAVAPSVAPDTVNSGALARLATDLQGRARVVIDNGSVSVTQAGAPWTFTGSEAASQAGSWFVGLVASGVAAAVHSDALGGILRVVVASQAGGGSTITGSVWASQANTPWLFTGSVGATQLGAPWTFTGSVAVGGPLAAGSSYQGSGYSPVFIGGYAVAPSVTPDAVNSGALARLASDLQGRLRVVIDNGSVSVTQGGAPWSFTGSTAASQAGSWFVGVVASGIMATVHSDGAGGMLRVLVASQAGGGSTITGSVWASQANTPWIVIGSMFVSQADSPWVTTIPSLAVRQSNAPWTFLGSVAAYGPLPVGSAFQSSGHNPVFLGGYAVAPSVAPDTVNSGALARLATDLQGRLRIVIDNGSASVTQAGAPWSFTGSAAASQAGSWFVGIVASGVAAAVHSDAAGGMLRVLVASQAGGGSTITGSVWASQANTPWIVIGSMFATQQTSPWVVLPGSSGAVGLSVASVVGVPTVVGSVRVSPPNTAIAVGRVVVSASGTALPATNLTGRMRVTLYHRGMPGTPNSAAIVWIGNTGVTSSTGFPLDPAGTLNLELGPGIQLYGATVGSHATNINSGQEVALFESS